MGKSANVHSEHWSTLVTMRTTETSQAKSEHMQSISKGKGSTIAQLKAIEREVVSRLVRLWIHRALMCDLYHKHIWRCVYRLLYVLTSALIDFADNAEELPTIPCRGGCGSRQGISTIIRQETQCATKSWKRDRVYSYSSVRLGM